MNYEGMTREQLIAEMQRLDKRLKELLDHLDEVLPEHEAKLKESE